MRSKAMQKFIDKLKKNALKEQFSGCIFKVQNSHIPEKPAIN